MKWIIRVPIVVAIASIFATFLIVEVHTTAIVNGEPTNRDEFPFMAALGWINNATGEEEYLCGGVLVDVNFVLTAAHCLFFDGKLPDVIQIGGYELNSMVNERHTVKSHFIYPEYKRTQAYNDIALLELNERSWKDRALLYPSPMIARDLVTAIGYGTTEFAGSSSNYLQKVGLRIMPEKDCQRFFRRQRKFKRGILPSHICAGDADGYKDTCQGDSGGPLVLNNIYVVGITSAGQACSGNPPAIYTRVSSFIEWMKKILPLYKVLDTKLSLHF